MKSLLVATTLLTPCLAFAQLSSVPGLPASSLNQPNGPAQLDANGQANALPVIASGARSPRTLAARLGDLPSIIDLGADPTGALDSTAAFNAASNSNHDFWVPPGRYTIAGCLQMDMVGLRGPGIYQRTASGDLSLSAGAVLAFQPSTKGCPGQITTTHGGLSIQGLTFYWPEQDGSQAPVAGAVGTGGAAAGATTIPVANAASITPGALVFGTGISAMTRVTAVNTSANTVTLENKTTAALAAGAALTTWSPVVYPPLLENAASSQLVDLTFERNAVLNAYDFLTINPTVQGAGDWRITDNRIYAIRRGFDFSGSVRETTQVANNNFTFGIYGSKALAGTGYLARWSVLNAEWVHVDVGAPGFVDNVVSMGNLVHGYRYGQRVLTGALNLWAGVSNTYDGVATIRSVEGASSFIGMDQGGDHTMGVFDPVTGTYQTQISVPGVSFNTSGNVRASFTDMDFGYSANETFQLLGTGPATVSIRGGKIEAWGLDGATDDYAVRASNPAGDILVSTVFKASPGGNQDGIVLSGVGNAALVGNVFDGVKVPLLAYSGAQAVIAGNTTTGTTGGAALLQFPGNFTGLHVSGNNWDATGPSHVGWPAAVARVSATQVISGAAKTKVLFAATGFDDMGSISGSSFTAGVAGYYQVGARVAQSGSGTAGDLWTLSLDQAGSQSLSSARDYVMPATPGAVEMSDLVYLAKGDTVAASLTRASGSGSWTVPADGSRSRFTIQLVQ